MSTTGPGLDLEALRALRTSSRDLTSLRTRLEAHLDAHDGYVAFSGGKDSLVALHLAHQVDPEIPVAFFDSGLEYPETYRHLDHLANAWNLNLHVIRPEHTTLEVLIASGHWTHDPDVVPVDINLHQVLITEPAARAHEMFGAGEVWGVRAQESRGRAAAYSNALPRTCTCCTTTPSRRAHHGGRIARVDGTVAFGPVWDWKTDEIWNHIARHQLPVNPVYAKLRALGAPESALRISHMVDGSLLEHGRLVWLRRGWPALFDELAGLLPRLREFI